MRSTPSCSKVTTSSFRVSNAEIAALLSGDLRVQRLKGDAFPLGFRLGRNWGGRLLLCCIGICHHLLNERIAVQRIRVNHFAVDDAPMRQILPNLFRVDIIEGILLLLRLNLL